LKTAYKENLLTAAFVCVLLALLASVPFTAARPQAADQKPNIVLIWGNDK
jgi:hypothetical protein